jgi:hypothetical protein
MINNSLRQITSENFHDATAASFKPCSQPDREPDFVSSSGSAYWRTGEGVIRLSDHWCFGIRSCDWYLDGKLYCDFNTGTREIYASTVCGFCRYADFVDKLSDAYRVEQVNARIDAMRRNFQLHPVEAAFRHSLPAFPANPLKGSGYHRIENFNRSYLAMIPPSHKDQISSRRTGGYFSWAPCISPEAAEMIQLAEAGILEAPLRAKREEIYSNDDH